MMTQSDLEALLSMGFEKGRAEMAVQKTGGLQGALNWLEENQEKPLEELQAAGSGVGGDVNEVEGKIDVESSLKTGEQAMSLVCNECGKKFRTHDQASFHASKTEHTDFSESSVEIASLTEHEKAAKLKELREKVAAKRAGNMVKDREEQKRNEKIRQKATQESQDMKEEVQRQEQIRIAARKRQDKLDDAEAKRRIKARIEADKAERKRKAEMQKLAREGKPVLPPLSVGDPAPSSTASSAPSAAPPRQHNEARLRLQTPAGSVLKTYPAETTLLEVAQQLEAENGQAVTSFTMNFPRKLLESGIDFGMTLKEAGLVPSAVLIVK